MATLSEKPYKSPADGQHRNEQAHPVKRRSSTNLKKKPAKLTKTERAIVRSLPANWWESMA